MIAIISIIFLLAIAIFEGVCFFNVWLNIGMDNEILPYILTLTCLTLFLIMPYLVTGGFMRLALSKDIPKLRSAVEFVAALLALSALFACWYVFSKGAVAVFQNSGTVSDSYDALLRMPFICAAVELLILPSLFLKRNKTVNGSESQTETSSFPDEKRINTSEKENEYETLKENDFFL